MEQPQHIYTLQPTQQQLQTLSQQNMQPPQQNMQPLQQNMQPPQQSMQPPQQDMQPLQQNMQLPQQNMHPPQQNMQPPQQNMQPLQQNMQPPQQNTQPPQQNMHLPHQAQLPQNYQPTQHFDPSHQTQLQHYIQSLHMAQEPLQDIEASQQTQLPLHSQPVQQTQFPQDVQQQPITRIPPQDIGASHQTQFPQYIQPSHLNQPQPQHVQTLHQLPPLPHVQSAQHLLPLQQHQPPQFSQVPQEVSPPSSMVLSQPVQHQFVPTQQYQSFQPSILPQQVPTAQPGQTQCQGSAVLPQDDMVAGQAPSREEKKLKAAPRARMKILSIAQLVMGVFTITFGLTLISIDGSPLSNSGYGLWCGTAFVIVGGVGYASVTSNAYKWIGSALILNIVNAAVFFPSLLIFTSISLSVSSTSQYTCVPITSCTYNASANAYITLNILMLIISIAELIISGWIVLICHEVVGSCYYFMQSHKPVQHGPYPPQIQPQQLPRSEALPAYQAYNRDYPLPTAPDPVEQHPANTSFGSYPQDPPICHDQVQATVTCTEDYEQPVPRPIPSTSE